MNVWEVNLELTYVYIHATLNFLVRSMCLLYSFNPGRIDPEDAAWEEARKPLAAAWQTASGARFYTVNVHFSSKRFSSPPQGDARPPINGGWEKRTSQVNVTAVSTVLSRT